MVTVDNLYPFIKWPEIFTDKRIMIRIDPGVGDGHHDLQCNVGGSFQKFGIPISDIEKIMELSKKYNINIIGLHVHSGSGIKNISTWLDTAKKLLELSKLLNDVEIINLGGGIPIKEN